MPAADPDTIADPQSIQRAIEALATHNVDSVLVNSREEALAKLRELVPEGSEVFVNTSATLEAIGYTEYMHGNQNYVNLHDQMMALPDPVAQREFRRKTTTADYFVGSVQAIAETGEIVIASSSGSQIGAYSYGARRVILVAGTQKICPYPGGRRGPYAGIHPGAPRPLAGRQGRRSHSHRQVHGYRA